MRDDVEVLGVDEGDNEWDYWIATVVLCVREYNEFSRSECEF